MAEHVAHWRSVVAGTQAKSRQVDSRTELALAVASGSTFLGEPTTQGAVVYLALEEIRTEVGAHFRRMGAEDEAISIHFGPSPHDAVEVLRQWIQEKKAVLAIVDPMLRFVRVEDANDYAQVTNQFEPLVSLARETDCHLLLVHHANKGARQNWDSILGSTAIFGAVDTAILLREKKDGRICTTRHRYGPDTPDTPLWFDLATGRVTSQRKFKEVEAAPSPDRIRERILTFVSGGPIIEEQIRQVVVGDTAVIGREIRALLKAGELSRQRAGVKGDPYIYSR